MVMNEALHHTQQTASGRNSSSASLGCAHYQRINSNSKLSPAALLNTSRHIATMIMLRAMLLSVLLLHEGQYGGVLMRLLKLNTPGTHDRAAI
jgi:hypothetical protein